MTERRPITLPLCLLGAGVVHGLCVAAILPMLITLPGPGSVGQSGPIVIDVEMVPASASSHADAHDSQPSWSGKSDGVPLTTSALPAAPEPVAPPETAPAVAEAAPPAPPETAPTAAEAAPPAPDTAPAVAEDAPAEADSAADASPPAEAPREAEPDQPVASVAEVAPSGTDPVTTQSTTPMAGQGGPEQGPAKGIDRLLQEADRPAAPPVSPAPTEPASVARAEPASLEPSVSKLDAPAARAKEPVSKAAPGAKAPAKAGTAVAKRPGSGPAKRAVSRPRRPARVQAQAAANQGTVSTGLFGGVFASPSAPAKATTRRTTTQR